MSSISAVSTSAVNGLNAATARLDSAARDTANASIVPEDRVSISPEARAAPDLIQSTTDRITASTAFTANLKTLQTAQDLDATLFGLFGR